MADNKYVVGYAKLATSKCKKCKQKIDKGALRVGKVTPNPFNADGGDMKQWFHPTCMFETFVRARAATKKIDDPDDAEGFGDLEQEDKDTIKQLIEDYQTKAGSKGGTPKKTKQTTLPGAAPVKTPAKKAENKPKNDDDDDSGPSTSHTPSKGAAKAAGDDDPFAEKDNSFRQFRRLCADIADENSHLGKTKLVNNYITKGHSGDGFRGDLYLLIKLLLPGMEKRIYNLNSKQLVKLFSQIFGTNLQRMTADLDQGDVAETVRVFFEESKVISPQKKSTLSLQEVDHYLEDLSKMTKEDEQQRVLNKMTKRCTANDLKMFVRLIKHDLRINCGAKIILDGLNPDAYPAYQASRNLRDVVERVQKEGSENGKPGLSKTLSVRASLLTPVLPMLAEACKSVEQAMKKCPNGFYAEIKYDGERVQVHKKGHEFKYYSRSLKPVLDHKVRHFKDFIPKAFPTGNDLILDAEVLLVDNNTGNPLPFGTLGVHKKAAFQDATVCLFVFDCLLINSENLMEKPIKERRKILEKNMAVVKNRVNLSEIKHITKPAQLQDLMSRVFREGLEGLVLKDVNGLYEPGKRHWLKVKKDYLHEGSMADSADLVVLGAYYGTGNKGGIMSVFLMGVHDPDKDRFVTVSKVSGFEDKVLEKLNKEMDMVKISKDFDKVPRWLKISKPLVPDFVVSDPRKAPVWEIIGAEFSKAEIHTADGISIRFPRVQKMRDDKTWKEATDLPRLKKLFKESKEKSDLDMAKALGKSKNGNDDDDDGDDGDGGSSTEVDDDDDDRSGDEKTNGRPSKAGPSGESSTAKRGLKRSASGGSGEEESPKKKSKPSCKYGAKCYQKNPQHFQDFSHPSSVSTSPSKTTDQSKNNSTVADSKTSKSDLPNIFHGCKIVLPSNIDKKRELRRFIIAFDGDLLQEFDAGSATHVISDSSASVPSTTNSKATKVKPDWLWACIRKKQMVPTGPYTP